jgi:hypothetical protein
MWEEAMNESDCKLITEKLLGECWHEWVKVEPPDFAGNYNDIECLVCRTKLWRQIETAPKHRTFQDPQDFFSCFDKLVELGKWQGFEDWVSAKWVKIAFPSPHRFFQWFLSHTESGHYRLCVLCAEWLRKENKDGQEP